MRQILLSAFFGSALLFIGSAHADPAALLLDVEGDVSPALGAYDEVDAEQELDLGKNAVVTFTHYEKCETATVTGGLLYVRASEWLLRKGKVDNVERGDCPDIVNACSGPDCQDQTLGGVVLRSITPEPETRSIAVSENPVLILTGAESDQVAELALSDENGRLIRRQAARKGRNDWPANGGTLKDGETYYLDLLPKPGGKSYRITLNVSARAGDNALIRVE